MITSLRYEVDPVVSIIILAAGKSERMGRIKQVLPYGESNILQQVIDNANKFKGAEVILVLGHRAEEIACQITPGAAKIITNPDFEQGISSSLKCGITQISKDSKAVMVMFGDQPLIEAKTIELLWSKYSQTKYGIVYPVYKGMRGHPVIFDMRYKSELLELSGDVGARQIIGKHRDDALEVEVNSEEVIMDIDTIADYRIERNKNRQRIQEVKH